MAGKVRMAVMNLPTVNRGSLAEILTTMQTMQESVGAMEKYAAAISTATGAAVATSPAGRYPRCRHLEPPPRDDDGCHSLHYPHPHPQSPRG